MFSRAARDARVFGALLVLASCSRRDGPVEATPTTAARDSSAGAASAAVASPSGAPSAPVLAGTGDDADPAAPWPALVGDERWDAAWRALEALPEADRARPEVRYVRARVALERGEAAAALPLLEGLDVALPLLADDIARRRHQAMLVAGPFDEAGAWFAARSTAEAQLDAARAFERAKDPRRARAAVERVLAAEKRTRTQEAEARALRVRVADRRGETVGETGGSRAESDSVGDTERADARWLCTLGADLAAASDALALVTRVDPGHPLTAEELMVRARVLADARRTDDALHALDLVAGAPGASAVPAIDRARARGMALYQARGRGLEAAKALTECAGTGGPHAAEDAFHAARALSRADHDDEAVRGYEDVEHRFPRSKWAEQAAFFVPYLRMLHGQWKDCALGFEAYLHAHTGAEEAADARRDVALCRLLEGDAKGARVAFEHLVEDETDPTASARMADMAALAALRDGDRTHAIARWSDVVRTRPLSWPALVARARLAEAGVAAPPAIDPAESSTTPPVPLAVVVPAPADMLHRLGLDADAELALRDRESAVTGGAGPRATEALCMAYGELGRARRRYQIAQSLPSALFNTAPGPRTRWAWECAFPSPYAGAVHAAEAAEKLPPGLLWAVMRQESGFDPGAVSPARAVGLMQLLPETARPIADEMSLPHDDARLTSPSYALRVGARDLRKLLDQFHGDIALAVAAYNGGAESVERWLSRAPGMKLDSFVERIPFKETREYVAHVMGNLARYGYLARGEAGVPQIDLDLKR
jgi:soluble lytic murein transglycosylase